MIAKSYKLLDIEIIMTKREQYYNIIVKNKQWQFVQGLDYEDADFLYSLYMVKQLEVAK
jgi:hypothetical protein